MNGSGRDGLSIEGIIGNRLVATGHSAGPREIGTRRGRHLALVAKRRIGVRNSRAHCILLICAHVV